MKIIFLLVGFWLVALRANAGFIELMNGDHVEGEFVRLDGNKLIWNANNFGELTINRSNLKKFVTSQLLAINGKKTPCKVINFENDQLTYSCGDSPEVYRAPFLTLNALNPFSEELMDKWVHHGKFNLFGAYSRGNEIRDEWNAQIENEIRRGNLRHNLGADYSRSSWFYSPPQTRWAMRYSLDWFFRERLFWFNNTEVGADSKRGLDKYFLVGSGVGYQFWEDKKSALSIKAGFAYMNEEYIFPPDTVTDLPLHNDFVSTTLGTQFHYTLPLGVSFFHKNQLIYSLEDGENWRLHTESGLSSMILSKIYAEFKVEYSLDNEPLPGREGKDVRMSVGVSYKW